jgi:hypothetical protein
MRRLLLMTCLLLTSVGSHADGLTDLKAALQKLPGEQPIKALVSVKSQSHQGDGDDVSDDSGAASLMVEESAQGLLMQIAPDMLARAQAEELAQEADKKAKAPTAKGLGQLNLSAIRAMTSASEGLKRAIKDAIFKSERADTWNGQPARLLSFEIDPSKLSKQEQKYTKSFEGSLQIWIAADGTPLESRRQTKTSGRAFLVISYESTETSRAVYQRVGDRLIATRRESSGGGSGMGMRGEGKTEFTLQLR